MSDTLIVMRTLLENTWTMLSSIEVLDLGFSVAEMYIGILFFLLLVHVLKILIFAGNMSISSLNTSVQSSIEAEKIAANNALSAQMRRDRAKAKNHVYTQREAGIYAKNKKDGISALNPQKHKN